MPLTWIDSLSLYNFQNKNHVEKRSFNLLLLLLLLGIIIKEELIGFKLLIHEQEKEKNIYTSI